MPVEDHDLAAGDFEGVRPGGRRGSGGVIIWDEGGLDVLSESGDHVSFVLHGHKLVGRFALTRTGERRWILVKACDDHSVDGSDIVREQPASVRSGKTIDVLAGP